MCVCDNQPIAGRLCLLLGVFAIGVFAVVALLGPPGDTYALEVCSVTEPRFANVVVHTANVNVSASCRPATKVLGQYVAPPKTSADRWVRGTRFFSLRHCDLREHCTSSQISSRTATSSDLLVLDASANSTVYCSVYCQPYAAKHSAPFVMRNQVTHHEVYVSTLSGLTMYPVVATAGLVLMALLAFICGGRDD